MRLCNFGKAYYSHESGTWEAQRHITRYILKMPSVMKDIELCLVNCQEIKKLLGPNSGQPDNQG